MRQKISALAVVTLLLVGCGGDSGSGSSNSNSATRGQLVNPFVGTQSGAADFGTGGGAGNTFPGATLPFGMVQFSPDTAPSLDNFSGGYTYSDTQMDGFSLTHISGAGCAIYQDIPFMPTVLEITDSPAQPGTAATNPRYLASFNHDQETAIPGYYQVVLNPESDAPINAELTATERSGMARFSFTAGSLGRVIINPGGSEMANSAASLNIDTQSSEVTGSATSGRFCYQDNSYTVYFVAQFDRPMVEHGTWDKFSVNQGAQTTSDIGALPLNAQPIPGGPSSLPGDPSGSAQAGGWVGFDISDNPVVQVRIGISFVSVDNARLNLQAENPAWRFDAIKAAAADRWEQALSRITVSDENPRLQRMFYTALYHSMISPNIYSDVNGEYLGMDGAVHQAQGHTVYSSFSGWDTYRSQMPLLAILEPRRTADMLRSVLLNAEHSGSLPKWSYANQHTDVMVGDPVAIILASAHAFGVKDFDTDFALQAMVKGASQPAGPDQYLLPGNAGYIQRPGLVEYQQLGYIPYEENAPSGASGLVHRGLVWGTSSTTLEYAVADFAIDQFARRLGQQAQTADMHARSAYWRNLFNPTSLHIEPRLASGLFMPGTDPASGLGFTEGSGAQYSWYVPHDMAGLIDAMGGTQAVESRLDTFFEELNAGPESIHAFLGNEPSLYTPWIYAWLGKPAKTGPIVKAALDSLYDDAATGMPGNDDLGAMSSWWVMAALGLMPSVPGTDILLLNEPLFARASIQLDEASLLITRDPGGDYVQLLRVDGSAHKRAWLHFAEIADGARLHYQLGDNPRQWGTEPTTLPPSFPID